MRKKVKQAAAKPRRINSRAKGAAFEREIATQLSKWCGFTCRRTPASGGWAKTGDITPRDPSNMLAFPFCLELKKRESWNFSSFFSGKGLDGVVKSWWEQCQRDAALAGKMPVLVFTRNHDHIYCLVRAKDFKQTGLVTAARAVLALPDVRIFRWSELLKLSYRAVAGEVVAVTKRGGRR